jgi:hypothetical protein
MVRVGRHAAKGMVVELWTLAQDYWFPNKNYIPIEKLKQSGLQQAIDVGLAIPMESGYFAIGTEKAFDWLFQKQEAGKQGGETKAKNQKKKLADASARQTDASARLALGRRNLPSLLSSPSSSLSSPSSDSTSDSNSLNLPASKMLAGSSVPTWDAYRDAYLARYGVPPVRNASVNSQLSNLVKRLGADESPLVAAFYLTHNDSFYLKALHPVGLLLRDAEKLRTEWATGHRMLGAKAREVERMQHNSDAWDEGARILNERRQSHEAK